ncbi:hypothetical protein J0383_16920 [Flavobacterium endoglycinae]|uniref:Uncharacterized protein n=1 Tax=Flavobacterium endoglycinae TaxID=2816357 RepID=A0ABX7QBG5_9FLAO|nr:hypothetical protein [Flavobacterium endoglycinae]QSW87946.1 hypothetical protein J0383_16920 [Flavobacterium endoglycinae]
MRKLIVFLVFMNMLLFGGGQYLNANTFGAHNHHHLQKHRVKFTNQDRGTSIIEDAADVDLEEDLVGGDDVDLLTNKYFAASYSLVDTLYLALSDQSAANDSNRFKISTPVFGHSNPIYITQRVLRI